MLPHFTECTFQLLNKAMQNRQWTGWGQLDKADDFEQHQGGPGAGSCVLGWVSLPWHTTASRHQCPRTPLTGKAPWVQPWPVDTQPLLTPASPKIIHELWWGMDNAHLTSSPDTGHTARLGGSQGHPAMLLCGANPSQNTLLTHLHRTQGQQKGEKLSGVRRCLHVGREASPEHRVKGSGPCQTAAHPHPHNPRDRECQHHARLSQDKTRGLYLLGMARARLPQGSSAFTSY